MVVIFEFEGLETSEISDHKQCVLHKILSATARQMPLIEAATHPESNLTHIDNIGTANRQRQGSNPNAITCGCLPPPRGLGCERKSFPEIGSATRCRLTNGLRGVQVHHALNPTKRKIAMQAPRTRREF